MTITIHRGIDQIGGCITEIKSKSGTKIIIDLGHNLPDGDNNVQDLLDNKDNLDSILEGVSDIFYSHYHGDHIGFESKVPASIKQHMGELSIKMVKALKYHMLKAEDLKEDAQASLDALEKFEPYKAFEKKQYGDISVTPMPVSHSALDAYMFLIECDGHTILHTGDFRDHGYKAGEMLDEIEQQLPSRVDVLITEGTMLGRGDKRVMSEQELQDEAYAKLGKYNFVMCSSMDIDRITSFYTACRRKDENIRIIADNYQVEQIKTIKPRLAAPYSELFAYPYGKDMEAEFSRMKRHGFLMFIRNSPTFTKRIEEVFSKTGISPSDATFFYSQFMGYILPSHNAFKQNQHDFVYGHKWKVECLHTSGHASKEALTRVADRANPSTAIIPIHKEEKGSFQQLKLSVHCPIVEDSCRIDDIEIIIK